LPAGHRESERRASHESSTTSITMNGSRSSEVVFDSRKD
jgi:hypothetical protein